MIKTFFSRLLLLVILLTIALISLNAIYAHTIKFTGETGKFAKVPDDLELVNLGSSHGACAFSYDVIPQLKAFNFALSAQHLVYDYGFLKLYTPNLARKCVVLIPVSYFSFNFYETQWVMQNPGTIRYYPINLFPIQTT